MTEHVIDPEPEPEPEPDLNQQAQEPRMASFLDREEQKAPLRILSIDGDGGLVTAAVLQQLEGSFYPHRINDLFDLVRLQFSSLRFRVRY